MEEETVNQIKARFPEAEAKIVRARRIAISIKKDILLDFCKFLRETGFDHLSSIAGVDRNENFEVVYFLWSYERKQLVILKVPVSKEEPKIPSVVEIWEGADWHERETYEMLGITFEGHPDLRHLLLPEDFIGYPLRKDYKLPGVE